MKVKKKNWRLFLPLSLTALIFLSACADLKSIRRFADTSADSVGYTSLSREYLTSIERQKRYQEEKYHAKLDELSKKRKEQEPALLGLHMGVEEYMSALGALASDELVSYNKSLDSFADGIKTTRLIKDNEADAFAALTKLIAKAATDAYRQKKLKQLIGDSNKDFQIVIGAMKELVGRAFIESLDNEEISAEKYYKEIIKIAEAAPPQQASIELVRDKWLQKKDEIEAKKQACNLYVETLSKIGEGHLLLFDKRDQLSSKQLLDTINSYGKDVSKLYNKIKDLK